MKQKTKIGFFPGWDELKNWVKRMVARNSNNDDDPFDHPFVIL